LKAAEQKCEKALTVFQSGDYRGAIPALQEAIDGKSCPSYFYLHLGVAQLNIGDLDAAKSTLLLFLQDYPAASSGWYNLGLIHFATHQFQMARTAFESAVLHNPKNSEALKMLGRVQVALGQTAEAERTLVAATEQDRRDYESRYLLARLYQTADRMKEAADMFEQSILINPDFARSHAFLGTVYYALGEGGRALQSFQKAVALNQRRRPPPQWHSGRPHPDFVPHLEYGIFLQRMGSLEGAREHLLRAHQLAPTEIEPIFELSRVYYRTAESDRARTLLLKGIAIEGADPRLHYLLGRICYEQGDQECGDRHMELSEKNRK
jgi:tetratricopeptide (TPR) repeat protein